MKLHKILAAVSVSVAAATAMTFASSASIQVVEGGAPDLTTDAQKWMVMLYKNDGPEKEIDYGLDVTKIAKMSVQFTTDDADFFEGMFGGALVASCGPASITPADHNWVQSNWWGVIDDDAEIWTQDPGSPVLSTKVGDYTYEVSMPINDSNCFYPESNFVQAAIMEWGKDTSLLVVLGMQFYDASGNLMIEFDAKGNANIPNLAKEAPAETEAAPAETEAAPAETEAAPAEIEAAPAETEAAPAETEAAPAEETVAAPAETEAAPAQTEAAPAETEAAPAQTEAAPAATTVPATSAAPAAGDVAAATNSSKGSPDTGIADVAAIAGLAIVAGGAVLVAKKRK